MIRSCNLSIVLFSYGTDAQCERTAVYSCRICAASASGDTRRASRLACGKESRRRGHCGPPGRFAL